MAFVAVDKDGSEYSYTERPVKGAVYYGTEGKFMFLSTGSIKKLIGYSLKWEDEPVKLV